MQDRYKSLGSGRQVMLASLQDGPQWLSPPSIHNPDTDVSGFWDEEIKSTMASALFSLRSLALEEASCHVVRTDPHHEEFLVKPWRKPTACLWQSALWVSKYSLCLPPLRREWTSLPHWSWTWPCDCSGQWDVSNHDMSGVLNVLVLLSHFSELLGDYAPGRLWSK